MNNDTKKTYLVGGAVRDEILGLPVHDNDFVVVGTTPEELLAKGYRQVGREFPVFLHPTTGEEYALARSEIKDGVGYQGFSCHFAPTVTLEEDLSRRDLTINAIAKDTVTGDLFAPHGGVLDVVLRKLRHVSPAFAEDPLRVLRVARFAARYAGLGFTIAPETMRLMKQLVNSGELANLTKERVWKETEKALREEAPEIYFEVLLECKALNVLFPELADLHGVAQPVKHHPEVDTFVHTMMVLKRASELSNDPVIRFAALLHDIGKGTTPAAMLPNHFSHEIRGADLVKELCVRYKVPSEFRDLAYLAAKHHTQVHVALSSGVKAHYRLLKDSDALRRPERFRQLLVVCEADAQGRTTYERINYVQADLYRAELAAALSVSSEAHRMQGLTGKALGEAMGRSRWLAVKEARGTVVHSLLRTSLLQTAPKR